MKKNIKFLILLIPFFIFSYRLSFRGKIFPNVFVCQYNLGGKNIKEAEKFLTEISSSKMNKKINLVFQNENWEIDPQKIRYQINHPSTVKKSYYVGRKGNFLKKIWEGLSLLKRKQTVTFDFQLDQKLLDEEINKIAEQIYIPVVNPQPKIIEISKKKKVVVEPGRSGREINREVLLDTLNQKFSCLDFSEIKVPIKENGPFLTEKEINQFTQRAEKFLNKSLKIIFKNTSWSLNDKDLLSFLSPKANYNDESINQYIENLKEIVESNPQNASFKFEGDKVVVFKPAREGILLDKKGTKEKIFSALEKLENSEINTFEFEIPFTTVPPKIKNEDVNNLGIKQEIGIGYSSFKGSIPQRVHNINLASEKLNGFLVEPGQTFSFNQSLGEVSEKTGFKKAYIIKEGRTILGDGGGVCQVSTTLFRAVLNAGLPIIERHAHAYRVSYYEQDSQPGFDATVYDPTADFKFKNDTSAYILIQSEVDLKNKNLRFILYGTPDGRRVEIGKIYIWDLTPPPPDLYIDDPTLPIGIIKQIDWKAWGAKVRFNWTVTRGNEILQQKTFYSQYRPWQAIYLRGISPK